MNAIREYMILGATSNGYCNIVKKSVPPDSSRNVVRVNRRIFCGLIVYTDFFN